MGPENTKVKQASECGDVLWEAAMEIARQLSWMRSKSRKKAIKLALVAVNDSHLLEDPDEVSFMRSPVRYAKDGA